MYIKICLSCVEIKAYSAEYFAHIAGFETLYQELTHTM